MTYHERFWVVTGASRSVLLVAAAVAWSQAGVSALESAMRPRPGRPPLMRFSGKWYVIPTFSPHAAAWTAGAASTVFDLLIFLLSITRLAVASDGVWLDPMLLLVILAIATLVWQTFSIVTTKMVEARDYVGKFASRPRSGIG